MKLNLFISLLMLSSHFMFSQEGSNDRSNEHYLFTRIGSHTVNEINLGYGIVFGNNQNHNIEFCLAMIMALDYGNQNVVILA